MRKFLIVFFCFFMTYAHCATLQPGVPILNCQNNPDDNHGCKTVKYDDSCYVNNTQLINGELYTVTRSCKYYLTGTEGPWDNCTAAIYGCNISGITVKCTSKAYQSGVLGCKEDIDGFTCYGCFACPANAICDGTSSFKCKDGYYKSGLSCMDCPDNAECEGTSSFSCNSGYYKSGTTCEQCPSYEYENVTVSGKSDAGAENISGCYIEAKKTLEDEVGWFYYSKSCYHPS